MSAALLTLLLHALLAPADPPATPPAGPEEPTAAARAMLDRDLYEDALDAAGTILERWPDHAPARVVMGDALYRRGDFEESERHYRRAAEIDGKLAAAHFGVGRILRTQGRYGEAAESFGRAASLAPAVPKYLRVLANHLARREDSLGMLRRYVELAGAPASGEEPAMIRNVEAWIALLESLGDRPISELAKGEPGTLKLEVTRDQVYARLGVAGLKNQRFVFDTGATGVTISPRIVARAGLEPISPFTIHGTGARRTEVGTLVVIPEITVGEGIVLRNVPATIRDPSGPEEGLFGPSLLSGFEITVDIKGRRLILEKPAPDGVAPRPGRAEPFRNVGGEIFITAQVNRLPFNAMVDTGSAGTIIGRSTVGRVPGLETMRRWGPAGPPSGVVGIGGSLEDQRIVIKGTLSFAGRSYPADGLISADLSGFSRNLESEVYVILGKPHLDDTPFTISYRRMTVTFAPQRAGG